MNTKQVIVIRKDLKMRRGKEIAQGAHASMAFLTRNVNYDECGYYKWTSNSDEINHWLQNSFRKICVYVNSEEELIAIYEKAVNANLRTHLVEDNGATEFNGIKTKTCCAIGPHYETLFDGITDELPLL